MQRRLWLVREPVRVRARQADAEHHFSGPNEPFLRCGDGSGIGCDVIRSVEPDVGHAEIERDFARSQFDADAVARRVVFDEQLGTMQRHRECAERDLAVSRFDRRMFVAHRFEIAAEDLCD